MLKIWSSSTPILSSSTSSLKNTTVNNNNNTETTSKPPFVVNSMALSLGSRVSFEGKVGIVRFLGPVQFREGLWCGIELDLPVGKNDGTVYGVEYFKCRQKHGLFVPAMKVTVVNGSGSVTKAQSSALVPSALLKTPALESATPLVDYTPMRLGTVEKRVVTNRVERNLNFNATPIPSATPPPSQHSISRNLPPVLSAAKSQVKSDQMQIEYLKGEISNYMIQLNEQKLAFSEYKRAKDSEIEHLLTQIAEMLAQHELSIRQYQERYNEAVRQIPIKQEEWKEQMEEKARQWEQTKKMEFQQRTRELDAIAANLEKRSTKLETFAAELEQKNAEIQEKNDILQMKKAELEHKNAQLDEKEKELKQIQMELAQKEQNDLTSLEAEWQKRIQDLQLQHQSKLESIQMHYNRQIQQLEMKLQDSTANFNNSQLLSEKDKEILQHKQTNAVLEADMHLLTKHLEELTRKLDEVREETSNLASLEKRNEELNQELLEQYRIIDEMKQEKEEQHRIIDQIQNRESQLKSTITQQSCLKEQQLELELQKSNLLLQQQQSSNQRMIEELEAVFHGKTQQLENSFREKTQELESHYRKMLQETSTNSSELQNLLAEKSSQISMLQEQIAQQESEITSLRKLASPFISSCEEFEALFNTNSSSSTTPSLSELGKELGKNIQMIQNVAALTDGNRQDLQRIMHLAMQIQQEKESFVDEVARMLVGIPKNMPLNTLISTSCGFPKDENNEDGQEYYDSLQNIIHSLQTNSHSDKGAIQELYAHLKNDDFCTFCQVPGHSSEACCLQESNCSSTAFKRAE